ncbi:MAG: GNAT family N-acetyltransferase, partial [Comamonadaceae bacterium]
MVSTIRHLGDDLWLRQANASDADRLAAFHAPMYSDAGHLRPDDRVRLWVHELLTRPHPNVAPSDFTVVEDRRTKQIVSSLGFISQAWSYAGIPFGVGRPELGATHPEYRNRGLLREQLELLHTWSAARGHLIQAIAGIPYLYRRFGYEMTVSLCGTRVGFDVDVPRLEDGEGEAFAIRPASVFDLAFFSMVSDAGHRRDL